MNVIEEVNSKMVEDSKKMRQAIANYNSFIFYCTCLRGMSLDAANYCWRYEK